MRIALQILYEFSRAAVAQSCLPQKTATGPFKQVLFSNTPQAPANSGLGNC
jgi:hypothetical protein